MLSFARQVKPGPRAGYLEGWVLEAMMLGVPFCDLGRKGKTGVQVHFRALGGASGGLDAEIRKRKDSVWWVGCGGMSRWFTEVAAGRQDGELAVCGLLIPGLLLLWSVGSRGLAQSL